MAWAGAAPAGGLIGAELAVGLFLGKPGTGGYRDKRTSRAAKELHEVYQGIEGAVCCRVLCKHAKDDPAKQKQACTQRIGTIAQRAAELILEARPELDTGGDHAYLHKREGRVRALLKRALAAMLG